MRGTRSLLCWVAALAVSLIGCRSEAPPDRPPPAPLAPPGPPPPPSPIRFRDVAAESGLQFAQGHAGKSPLSILDTANGGCAFLDFDLDGWLDVLLVGQPRCALYRNLGDGRFRDVTDAVKLGASGRWMGCAVADWDGDRYPDLLITGYRCLAMHRNGRGRGFQNVTRASGVATDLWTTSADFADVDLDGDLDLYVGAYVDYRIGKDDLCQLGSIRSACGPEHYGAERGRFYRNAGGGRFVDETEAAGLDDASGKTWGVIFCDYDGDGLPDLYLANDMVPCNLFHNVGQGRFSDVGLTSGTAYDPRGNAMGAMGVDWGDFDANGLPDLFVTTYYHQANALFRNAGVGTFNHASEDSRIALPTRPYVAFGGGFIDADNDGDLDLFTANGHVRDNIRQFDSSQDYAQPLQLLVNEGGVYEELAATAGDAFQRTAVGRGAAFGDYDNDGDSDVLVLDLEGPVRLLRNDSRMGNWLELRLAAASGNREALGARVSVTAAGRRMVRWVKRGGSVLSSHDSRLLVGLGHAKAVNQVEVRWPDGQTQRWGGLPINRPRLLRQTR